MLSIILVLLLLSILNVAIGFKTLSSSSLLSSSLSIKRCNNINRIKLYNKNNNIIKLYSNSVSNTNNDNDTDNDDEPLTSPRRLSYLFLWISLVTYAFTIAPGGSPEATAIDNDIIKTIIQTPTDGTVSPVFAALFNSLGIIPAIYASLLLPGANKQQKVPGLLFVISSFALGFFGLGPYLALRKINVDVTDSTKGRGSFLFENKLTSLGSLLFATYLVYFACTAPFEGDRLMSYVDLFNHQRLAHVSTIDFTILSIAMNEPMREDMQRRGWTGPDAAVFCTLPVFGPVIYLLLRPALPK